jgi:hypothetical protein
MILYKTLLEKSSFQDITRERLPVNDKKYGNNKDVKK